MRIFSHHSDILEVLSIHFVFNCNRQYYNKDFISITIDCRKMIKKYKG